MRFYFVNTNKFEGAKIFYFLPSIELIYWNRGSNITFWWLSVGFQFGFGKNFTDA